jgi:hypothetical protein
LAAAGLIFLGAGVLMIVERDPLLGEHCSTVSPDFRDECCMRKYAGTEMVMCIGSWKYDVGAGECRFICESLDEIQSFQDCVNAGNPVMESYPRQCRTQEGILFIEEVDDVSRDCVDAGGTWIESVRECENINQTVCEKLGGTHEYCASACRHDPTAEMCIEVCVEVCSFDEDEKRTYCTPEQKKAQMCTMEYMPVCGWSKQDGECLTEPCMQTYGNKCVACAQEDVIYWTHGECQEEDTVVCAMDAKICPDGTAVGRVGPDCEFAPCPTER